MLSQFHHDYLKLELSYTTVRISDKEKGRNRAEQHLIYQIAAIQWFAGEWIGIVAAVTASPLSRTQWLNQFPTRIGSVFCNCCWLWEADAMSNQTAESHQNFTRLTKLHAPSWWREDMLCRRSDGSLNNKRGSPKLIVRPSPEKGYG